MAKEDIDWLAVENDYRPNILSLREIGKKYNCTEGAIRKRAKKEGWVRDLSEKIKARTDDLVRRESVRGSTQNEQQIVEDNAQENKSIIIKQQYYVSSALKLHEKLHNELCAQTDELVEYERLGEILRNQDQYGNDKLNDIYKKSISLPSRIESAKKSSETLKTLVDLERRIRKIDDNGTDNTFEDWLRKQRNGG